MRAVGGNGAPPALGGFYASTCLRLYEVLEMMTPTPLAIDAQAWTADTLTRTHTYGGGTQLLAGGL